MEIGLLHLNRGRGKYFTSLQQGETGRPYRLKGGGRGGGFPAHRKNRLSQLERKKTTGSIRKK